MPTLQEWIEYTDWERRKDLWRTGNFRGYISELIKVRVQKYNAWKIRKPFQETIDHFFREESTEKIMKLCSPYSNEHFRGETNLSMGRAVEYAHRGFHGVVNLMPFNCMPGTVVNALLCRFAQDYPRIPILKMIYDGTAQSSEKTRIEAFMYQARQVCETSKRKHG